MVSQTGYPFRFYRKRKKGGQIYREEKQIKYSKS